MAIIAELECDGHDSAAAKKLLATLEDTQQLHESHRPNILRELGE